MDQMCFILGSAAAHKLLSCLNQQCFYDQCYLHTTGVQGYSSFSALLSPHCLYSVSLALKTNPSQPRVVRSKAKASVTAVTSQDCSSNQSQSSSQEQWYRPVQQQLGEPYS